MGVIAFTDLRRGVNERHPATLPDGFVEEAWQVTYDQSQLCRRRNGSDYVLNPIDGTTIAVSLGIYTPDSTPANERLWMLMDNATFRYYTPAWSPTTVTPSPADVFTTAAHMVTLHGKLFIAAGSTTGGTPLDRLHVWDGTTLRRAGLATPAAPTAADTGAGSFSGTRYYRVRYAVLSGSTVLRRSEPSAVLTFAPSGAGASARVTKPATISEGETHWELEESIDNANFYRIATTAVGTTTYDDSLAMSAVATTGTLSATVGDYTVQGSARYLAVDRDRLVMLGNTTDTSKDSDVTWTVVGSDTSGVGNDERVPTSTGNRLTLDGTLGGRGTGIVAFDTQILVFKKKRVYLLSHTGSRQGAYRMEPLSTTFGALDNTIVEGVDDQGRAALYFLDEILGPMRYGAGGFVQLAPQIQQTFGAYFLKTATIPANALFVPKRREVWFHIAQTSATVSTTYPTLRLVYNVETGGVSWHFVSGNTSRLDGRQIASCITWANIPYFASTIVGAGVFVEADKDATSSDFGTRAFRAFIRTGTVSAAPGVLNRRLGVTGAVLGARPLAATSIAVTAVRDYGKETASVTASLVPNAATNPSGANERFVTVPLDDLKLSEGTTFQFEVGDASAVSVLPWSAEQLTVTVSPEGTNVGA